MLAFNLHNTRVQFMVGLLGLLIYPHVVVADSMPHYDRSEWNHWVDKDNDCQNARHELLSRESLVKPTLKDKGNKKDCFVSKGLWFDPFLNKFVDDPTDLDVDHIIPLGWAHQHGGWRWDSEQKQAFANDYENLLLVDDGRNQSKSDRGPGEWMPDNKAFYCHYIAKWRYLLDKYDLTPNRIDRIAIKEIHEGCLLN